MRKIMSNTEAVLSGVQITALSLARVLNPASSLRLAQEAVARPVSTLRLRSRSRVESRLRKA